MTVAVVEKIFLLLEALARAEHPLPLKQLAETTELPKPTAHRLLQTLQSLGYVVREENGTDYLLGHRIQELARAPIQQRIKEAALPLMKKLHAAVNETVNLGVREGLAIRYVDYLETNRPLRMIVRPGQSDSLFSTALGRAILSVLPIDEVARLLSAIKKERAATAPIVPESFHAMLSASRKRGWAEERNETVEGVCCFGISLRRLGFSNAAISISVPSVRCGEACRRTVETIFKEFNDDKN